MSNLVLVSPPLTGKQRYGKLAGGGSYTPPLGLCYLAAVTRKNGWSTHVIDCEILKLDSDNAVQSILKYEPGYVGITSATVSMFNAAEVAYKIKCRLPKVKIILGGPHLTAMPRETMEMFPQFDIGVIGEGENTIVELLQKLDVDEDLNDTAGLIMRDGGKIRSTKSRDYIADLDGLPFPAWDLLPDLARFYRPPVFGFKNLPSMSIFAGRGCIAKCTFCDRSVFGNRCRFHSAGYIIDMIKILKSKYGIKDIMFYDETFVINRKRLVEFCEKMIKEKLNMSWSCNARVDLVDSQILKLMKRAGCWMVMYGVESGSQKVLDFIKKDITLEQVRQAIDWTREVKMKSKAYFMIGMICDTKDTIKETIEFMLSLKVDAATINHFTPFINTEDYKRASEFGSFNSDWRLLNQHSTCFIPAGLDADWLIKARKNAVLRFYFRPRIILSYVSVLLKLQHILLLFRGFFAVVYYLFFDFLRLKDKER